MKPSEHLSQIRQAIATLQNLPEHGTEPFRIVLLTLKQKEAALEKVVIPSNR